MSVSTKMLSQYNAFLRSEDHGIHFRYMYRGSFSAFYCTGINRKKRWHFKWGTKKSLYLKWLLSSKTISELLFPENTFFEFYSGCTVNFGLMWLYIYMYVNSKEHLLQSCIIHAYYCNCNKSTQSLFFHSLLEFTIHYICFLQSLQILWNVSWDKENNLRYFLQCIKKMYFTM